MPATSDPERHDFVAQRTRLSYVDWGNPAAPLLILLHGNRDHARSWDWTAQRLRQDWHVIAPDLRGHGDSDWSLEGRYDFAAYLADLAALVDHCGGGPAAIVAHSLGAHIALRYAGLYPEAMSRITAIEAVGAPPAVERELAGLSGVARMRRWIDQQRSVAAKPPRRYASIDEAAARMRQENPALSDIQARHLTEHGIRRSDAGGWCWKFDGHVRIWPFLDLAQDDLDALWRSITCPVLLIYGTESWASDVPEMLERRVRDVRTVTVDGAGHWPHHDRFDQFMLLADAFLSG